MQPKRTSATLFIDNNSWAQHLHPYTKLCYILFTGVAVYAGPPNWIFNILLLLLNASLVLYAGLLKRAWHLLWHITLPLLLFMIPIHTLLHPDNSTVLLNIYGVDLYREGLFYSINILLHLTVVLTASLLFVLTTHPADLITAIGQSGKYSALAYLIGSPLLFLPAMRQRVETIQAAQRARGLDTEGNVIKRVYSLAPLIIPLVVGAIVEIEQRSIALEVRGFNSTTAKTSLRLNTDSTWQRLARYFMVAGAISITLSRLW